VDVWEKVTAMIARATATGNKKRIVRRKRALARMGTEENCRNGRQIVRAERRMMNE